MLVLKQYDPAMQSDVETFYRVCFDTLGWDYEPEGRHADIVHISNEYVCKGAFWCLYDGSTLVGTVAVRHMDDVGAVAEMKRLYVLPGYQGNGYGGFLFKAALNYAKQAGFLTIRLDTREDRTISRHLIEKYRFRRIEKYNQNEFAELFYELDLKDCDFEE